MLPNTNNCYGCASCAAACSHNAISLSKDKEGFVYPVINDELCINCGLCEKNCPSLNRKASLNDDIFIQAYSARRKDKELLKLSSSGGIASAIAEWFSSNGGYVCGVVYDSDCYGAHYECTNDVTVISKMRGSKYIQAETGSVYRDALNRLKSGYKVLFIGTACFVDAFKLMIPRIYHDDIFTIEIICHGPTSQTVLENFVKFRERQHQSKVTELNTRDKSISWKPAHLKIGYASGETELLPLYSSEFGVAFKILQRPCCYTCKYKKKSHDADLLIGDFWGLDKSDVRYDSLGVSAVVAFTEKGNELLSKLDDIVLSKATYEEIISGNPAIITPTKKRAYRGIYSKAYRKFGLQLANKFVYQPMYAFERLTKRR